MSTSEDLKWELTNYISNKNYNFNREKILNICDESNVDDAYNTISKWKDYKPTPLVNLIKLSNKLQNQLFNFYHKNSKLKDDQIKKLKNDFDILSVQRNLKILGIFVRLYKRDNKGNYLKFLPHTWTLIEKRLQTICSKESIEGTC